MRDGASITSDVVRDALLDHGQLFSANPKVTPPDFFRTAAGRLEVHDDRSVFFPNDGSPPVRSTTPSASAPKPLTSEQVQALVKQVGAAPEGGRLNAAQVSGLTAALGFPNQRLAQASAGLSTEPRAVTIHPGGGATVRFTGGELYLGPQGQILSESPATSRERASAANPVALTVAIVAAGASVLLAIFLIVAGAFVFRDAPGRSRGRRLHRIWAAVKIPVALAAALGLWWMFASFLDAAAVLPRGAVGRMSRWVRAAQWPVFG